MKLLKYIKKKKESRAFRRQYRDLLRSCALLFKDQLSRSSESGDRCFAASLLYQDVFLFILDLLHRSGMISVKEKRAREMELASRFATLVSFPQQSCMVKGTDSGDWIDFPEFSNMNISDYPDSPEILMEPENWRRKGGGVQE